MQFLYRTLGVLGLLLLLTGCSVEPLTLDLPEVFTHEDYVVYGYDGTLEALDEMLKEEIPSITKEESYRNASVYLARAGKDEYTITVSEDDLVFKYDYILLVNLR